MANQRLTALVVDDDPIASMTVTHALDGEGFHCQTARDGRLALEILADCTVDLVVTDLCMPVRHGHSLALELLSRRNRPLLVVHSVLDDPRMTRELILRGVDDVIYKPTHYPGFAAKAFVWAHRRRQQLAAGRDNSLSAVEGESAPAPSSSMAAVEAFFASTSEATEVADLAASIEADTDLKAHVLAIANNPDFNRAGVVVSDVHTAIRRIGMKRVAELALERLHMVTSMEVL